MGVLHWFTLVKYSQQRRDWQVSRKVGNVLIEDVVSLWAGDGLQQGICRDNEDPFLKWGKFRVGLGIDFIKMVAIEMPDAGNSEVEQEAGAMSIARRK